MTAPCPTLLLALGVLLAAVLAFALWDSIESNRA